MAWTDKLFLLCALIIDAFFLGLAFYIAAAFNEVDGEAARSPLDERELTV